MLEESTKSFRLVVLDRRMANVHATYTADSVSATHL